MNATTPKTQESFIAGANTSRLGAEALPWSDLDPKGTPRMGLNLRLNEHQLAKIRWVSEQLEISQQKLIKQGLMPWIDEQIEALLDRQH